MRRSVIVASAALAAGLTLMACGSGGGSAAPAGSGEGLAASAPPSCMQQYRVWSSGPAHAAGENLTAALNILQAASSASDIGATSAALKRAGVAARSLAQSPIPACADPGGYWRAVLVGIQDAADNAGTSQGQEALTAAGVALKRMPVRERKLAAELRRTVPGLGQNT
jgi:hypothetical protein